MLDKSRRLPVYTQDDPKNLLPHAARLRINEAYYRQQAIRDRALAKIEARCGGNWDGVARAELAEARMQAALSVLSVEVKEFTQVGLRGSKLQDVMRGELDAAGNSLEMSDLEKAAVWSELYLASAAPSPDGKSHKAASTAQRRGVTSRRGRAKIRSTWLDKKYFENSGLSDSNLHTKGGPSYNTMKEYRNGKITNQTRSVRGAIANAFKCEQLREVPE
jgi:hypothetical protein